MYLYSVIKLKTDMTLFIKQKKKNQKQQIIIIIFSKIFPLADKILCLLKSKTQNLYFLKIVFVIKQNHK